MSGNNLKLSLTLQLRDLASSGVKNAQNVISRLTNQTAQVTSNLNHTVGALSKVRAAAGILGVRSEQSIQREIQRTEAAYNRLQRSGTLSLRDQARSAQAAREKIRELNAEMGKLTLAQKTMRGMQTGATVAGGAAAAGYILSKPISQTMDYGMRLAQMSNTAFAERNTLGRIAGKRELNTAIENSVRIGGGTRESSAETLDTLIASGAMSVKESMGMLPTLTKAATASGADTTQLAQIGIRGMQTFGIKPDELAKTIDMAITAGQAGGFELKDMAKWLPQQMAAAKMSGMSGTTGMAKLLAANQAAAITAGTKDEAGNNLVNLLAKINSQDTAKDAKKQGIDLSGALAKARGNGVDSLDAFVGVVDQVVGKDKAYQALQTKLKTATGAERKATLESQADILQGSAIGSMVQDRQALMALVGIMGNRDYMADVQQKTLNGAGATEKNFAVISAEAGFKTQQALNEKAFATQTAFEKLTPLLGKVADGMTEHAREYPLLAAATVAATTALTALAAAAIGMAGISTLLGGKGGGLMGGLPKAGGAATDLAATAAAAAAGPGLLKTIATGAKLIAYSTLPEIASLGAGAMAASAAMVAAAGGLGYLAGDQLINKAGGFEGSDSQQTLGGVLHQIAAWFGNEDAEQQININLNLDGQQITQVVNAKNARESRRN